MHFGRKSDALVFFGEGVGLLFSSYIASYVFERLSEKGNGHSLRNQ